MSRKIRVSGACQTPGITAGLKLLLPSDDIKDFNAPREHEKEAKEAFLEEMRSVDVWATAKWDYAAEVLARNPKLQILKWPQITFPAFHPDITLVNTRQSSIAVMGCVYNSMICFWGWFNHVPVDRVLRLFCAEVFKALGYFDFWDPSVVAMREAFEECDLDFDRFFQPVKRQGVFMHSNLHAKLSPILHISRQLGEKLGADRRSLDEPLENYMGDPLIFDAVWPVYPEIGDCLGVPSGYRWKYRETHCFSLRDYIERSYADYEAQDVDRNGTIFCTRLHDDAYRRAITRQLELQA
jgi:hypothetical protein